MAGHASACGPIECSGNRGWKVRARLAWRALGHVLSFTVRDRGCRCSAKRPVRGNVNWRQGLIWGLGGFVAFNLASALGLPPDLPGTEVASLEARQIWWLATVVLTSVGLAMLVFGPKVTGRREGSSRWCSRTCLVPRGQKLPEAWHPPSQSISSSSLRWPQMPPSGWCWGADGIVLLQHRPVDWRLTHAHRIHVARASSQPPSPSQYAVVEIIFGHGGVRSSFANPRYLRAHRKLHQYSRHRSNRGLLVYLRHATTRQRKSLRREEKASLNVRGSPNQ
jgi:Probable cobalt transporter subunit (CbtA)